MTVFRVVMVVGCATLTTSCSAGLFDNSSAACPSEVRISRGDVNEVRVKQAAFTRPFPPAFFGFNLEWVEFEQSLWDTSIRRIRPEVREWLLPFAGAVYRYPGGMTPNHTLWSETVGDVSLRPPRKYVEWLAPLSIRFGLDEYLQFVQDVGGQAWYILNIRGTPNSEKPPGLLATEAAALAKYTHLRADQGLPRILRWELGNELDRGGFRWPPQKIADRANEVALAVRSADPLSQFVAFTSEYDVQGSASDFNKAIATGVSEITDEYAIHLYHDGKPQPPVPGMLNSMCRALDDVRRARPQSQPKMWITEHARVPVGAFVTPDWKPLWPGTANLEAALGVADLMTGAVQVPEVQGAFVHALHGMGGPWPLFHRSKDGLLHPGAIYWALRILRDAQLPMILPTMNTSTSSGTYVGGYDSRSLVMTDLKRRNFSVWTVNRSPAGIKLKIFIPDAAGRRFKLKHTELRDDLLAANNYADAKRLFPRAEDGYIEFDRDGSAVLAISSNSVNSLMLTEPDR